MKKKLKIWDWIVLIQEKRVCNWCVGLKKNYVKNNNYWAFHVIKKNIFFAGVCKMVVKITKETWEKCGTETICYDEEKKALELWLKMGDIEIKLDHSNLRDVVLRRKGKILGKKRKDITEEETRRYKTFFEGKKGVFIIEKVATDVIERCKLPKAIDFRKKFGYNHDDIMVCEETSKAEKIKLFPYKNIVLNKKFKGRKPDSCFKDLHLTVEVHEGNHDITTQTMKKKEKTCLKDIILKPSSAIQMILGLILINFLAK